MEISLCPNAPVLDARRRATASIAAVQSRRSFLTGARLNGGIIRQRRERDAVVARPARCSAADGDPDVPVYDPTEGSAFGPRRELTPVQSLVANVSDPVRLAGSAIVVGGALAAGYLGLGNVAPEGVRPVARVVSAAALGGASRFLLPWKRLFGVTEAQVTVAVASNAMRLYEAELAKLTSVTSLDVATLQGLRAYQRKLTLEDEPAAEALRTTLRSRMEDQLDAAMEVVNSRARVKDYAPALASMSSCLTMYRKLKDLAARPDAATLAAGTGPVTLSGGKFDNDRKMLELKQLYGVYLNAQLDKGYLEPSAEVDLADYKVIFGLGNKEATEVTEDVTTKVYRKLLRDAVKSGALDAAPSPARFLEDLCDRLQLDGPVAGQVHTEIYRQKLESSLSERTLKEEDAQALLRLRRLLCVPQKVVLEAQRDIAGKFYREAVEDALNAPAGGFTDADAEQVTAVLKSVRLDSSVARGILATAVRERFATYIKKAKGQRNRLDKAKELKALVFFNEMVVTPLLEGIKKDEAAANGETVDDKQAAKDEMEAILKEAIEMENAERAAAKAAGQEEEEEEEEADKSDIDEGEAPLSMQKARKALAAELIQPQKEITLREALEAREREDLYREFLLYCLSGNVVQLAMGSSVTIERDAAEFSRLQQLGDLLGLYPMEVMKVHQGLSEQAFESNAKQLLADGKMTPEKEGYLKNMQQQLGLPDAAAQKVIAGIVNKKLVSEVEASAAQGKLSVDEIRNLRARGVDVERMVPQIKRVTLYKKALEAAMSAGTGEWDAEEQTVALPADLGIPEAKAASMLKDVGKERTKNFMVQSVALLRQKRKDEAVAALKNLVACSKAVPEEKIDWKVKEELEDLYGLFASHVSDHAMRESLRTAFSLSDETATHIEQLVGSAGYGVEEEEEAFF
eukprot:jgi/Mesvir1/22647/Mv14082-RA.1